MVKKAFSVFFLTSYCLLACTQRSLSTLQPSISVQLNYSGDVDLKGDWSLSCFCVYPIRNIMCVKIGGIYKDGYFKKEIHAIEQHPHKNTAAFANLFFFSPITAMLDKNPALLAKLNKKCTAIKQNTHQQKVARLKMEKDTYNKLKPFLSKKEQEEQEYKIARLEQLYGQ